MANAAASQNGQPKTIRNHAAQPDEGAKHHQFALREIHGLGRLVDQDEAERDQVVDTALRHSRDDDLQL